MYIFLNFDIFIAKYETQEIMLFRIQNRNKNRKKNLGKRKIVIFSLFLLKISLSHAETPQDYFANLKNGLGQLIAPKPHDPRIPLISRRWVIMH